MTPIKPIHGRLYLLVATALVAVACLLVSVMPEHSKAHAAVPQKSSWSGAMASVQLPVPYRR